ncbi:hypothetical protein [Sinorhizobium medicae]
MHEIHQAGDPQASCARALAVGSSDRGKLRIGRGEEHDVARALPEVDRLVAVGDRTFLG